MVFCKQKGGTRGKSAGATAEAYSTIATNEGAAIGVVGGGSVGADSAG